MQRPQNEPALAYLLRLRAEAQAYLAGYSQPLRVTRAFLLHYQGRVEELDANIQAIRDHQKLVRNAATIGLALSRRRGRLQ